MLPVKKITQSKQLLTFCHQYAKASGLELELNYLLISDVYGLYINKTLVGGYVLHSTTASSRTLNCFVDPKNQKRITNQISLESSAEICCFWISRKIKKFKTYSSYLWIDIAIRTTFSKEKHFFYGTNSRGLAAIYSIPSVTKLMHIDRINGKPTWTFCTKKNQMWACIWAIIGPRINPFHNIKFNSIWPTKYSILLPR